MGKDKHIRINSLIKHYDFFKGVKGKFYFPEEEIRLPVYLNEDNRKYYMELAEKKKIAVSELINSILQNDGKFLSAFSSE